MPPRIGWIGTGVMGKSMAGHLMKKGLPLSVYTRTKSKADSLVKEGAKYAASPEELASECDVVFMMLGYPKDVEDVVFGTSASKGILSAMKKNSFLVDHTTSSPALASQIFEEAKKRGILSFDAPVSGGDTGAQNGQLVTMCGGDKDSFGEVEAIMKGYSRSVHLYGSAGFGQHAKMMNQIVVASNMIAACEALIYGYSIGLDVKQAVEMIASGAGGSYSLKVLGPRIINNDFAPGFYVEHFVKDLGLALNECEKMGITLPGLQLAHKLYKQLMDELNHGRSGSQALIKVLEHLNNKNFTK